MTLPASGAISLSQVENEIFGTTTSQISLNDSSVRSLAGIASGAISLGSLYGKSNAVQVNLSITANTSNYNIYNAALAANSAVGTKAANVTLTISGGAYVYGVYNGIRALNPNASIAGLDTGTGWIAGSTITVVNNGFITGWGGDNQLTDNSGAGTNGNGVTGGDGGDAIAASWPMTFTNNGTVAGGGGQGGFGGNGSSPSNGTTGYGGRGGIGRGGLATASSAGANGGGNGSAGLGGLGEVSTYTTAAPAADTFATSNGGRSTTTTVSGSSNTGGGGRSGGAWGQPGGSFSTNGRGRNGSGTLTSLGGAGGAAGKAVNGKTYVNGGAGISGGNIYGAQA